MAKFEKQLFVCDTSFIRADVGCCKNKSHTGLCGFCLGSISSFYFLFSFSFMFISFIRLLLRG